MKINPKIDYNLKKILLLLILLLIFIFNKKIGIYLILCGITAIIVYYSKLYHLPFDVSPLFFFQVVTTKYYGFGAMLLFVFIAYIIPKAIAGHAGNWMSYAFLVVSFFANFLVMQFPWLSLKTAGFIASIIQYIGGVFVNRLSKPLIFSLIDGVANMVNNMLWIIIFSDFIAFIMN